MTKNWKCLESHTAESESLVQVIQLFSSGILSMAGHEESCLNLPGPPGKAKYSLETDSEPVLWRKGEKIPARGVKKNLKPYAYNLSEPLRVVTACLLNNEPTSY